MNVDEAQSELNALATQIQEHINGFHEATGFLVSIDVREVEVTSFQDDQPKIRYVVEAEAKIAQVTA